jgi:hypothetical protein
VADAEARNADHDRKINAHLAASDAFVTKYGTFADEFSTL